MGITSCTPDMSDNQRMKLDATLASLYTKFDIDKNGILRSDEVAAALMILCRGSIASKIKFGIKIFSSTDTATEVKIGFTEFKTLIHFIFKLALESSNEIMIDYPLDQLAKDVANACFDFNGVEDKERGEVHLNQVMNFLNKQSTLGI